MRIGETVLKYAIRPTPDPLQVGAEGVLTVVVLNPGDETVTCGKIVISLPVGTNAQDLTANAGSIELRRPKDWNVRNSAGVLTCTPATEEAARIEGDALIFEISGFTVNAAAGVCTIRIDETTTAPEGRSRTAIDLPKFP